MAATVADHIDGLIDFSRNEIFRLPMFGHLPKSISLSSFDAIVIHYSLIMASNTFIDKASRDRIGEFGGLKAAFIQDEYRFVNDTIDAMRQLGIQVLFSCVPEREIEKVYPTRLLPAVVKVNVLTGYVPDYLLGRAIRPYKSRPVDIGYRSRRLPAWLGEMGIEKVRIGEVIAQNARKYDLTVDISTEETDRLYGEKWIDFIQNCRAVLGVESGASVFDFDGTIQNNVENHLERQPSVTFSELQSAYFSDREGLIDLRQISPRCFEAAALGSLMILYDGNYSGILRPWRHYVPLKKDHTNLGEVVDVLRDEKLALSIITNAYREVANSEKYSYREMARIFDETVESVFQESMSRTDTSYDQKSFRRLVFPHQIKMKLGYIKRKVIGELACLTVQLIRAVVPKAYQATVHSTIRRMYLVVAKRGT